MRALNPEKAATRLHDEVVPLWNDAGASALIALGITLEMMAAVKLAASPLIALPTNEMSLQAWRDLSSQLSRSVDLPGGAFDLSAAQSMPGLLEHTKRAVIAVAKLTSYHWGDLAIAMLQKAADEDTRGRRGPRAISSWLKILPDLVLKALQPTDKIVYCPFQSSTWLALFLAQAGFRVVVATPRAEMARIGALLAYIGDWTLDVHVGDPTLRPVCADVDGPRYFPISVAVTEFGLRLGNIDLEPTPSFSATFLHGEARQLVQVMAQTRGTVFAVVPDALLARTRGAERSLKEQLVRNGMLRAVVGLPGRTCKPRVHASLLVIDTEHRRERVVGITDAAAKASLTGASRTGPAYCAAIDALAALVGSPAAGPTSVLVTVDELAAQEFNLTVDRYLRPNGALACKSSGASGVVTLQCVAEIIRPQSLEVAHDGRSHQFAEVTLRDVLPGGGLRRPARIVAVADNALSRAMRFKLQPADLLLSVRGRCGVVALVSDSVNDDNFSGWIPAQGFAVVRLRPLSPITSGALFHYLTSRLGQKLLSSLVGTGRVPTISMGDLRKLQVMIPTAPEADNAHRAREEVNILRSKIDRLETEIERTCLASWPMTSPLAQLLGDRPSKAAIPNL